MSFLPLDELDPTLSDVLAFIDDFDRSDSDPNAVDADAVVDTAAVKRKKSRAAASRRFQRKKKAELLTLPEQATALQTRLQQLQAGRSRYRNGKTLDETQKRKVVAAWIGRAELERCRRLEAEAHNRQLKAVLARQKHTARVVEHLLQNVTSALHIEEGLRTPTPVAGFGPLMPSLDDAIYADLASRMGRMYLDADDVFSTGGGKEMMFITDAVDIGWDPRTGVPFVELRANLPVAMNFRETADVGRREKANDRSQYKKHDVTALGLKKEAEVELQGPSRSMPINVMSLSRAYDEEDRALSTWTSLVCDHPLNAAVRFREQGWVMMSASPSNPLQRCTVQGCYRLAPDVEPGLNYAHTDRDAVTAFVLQQLGAVMRDSFVDMGKVFINVQEGRSEW